MYFGEHIIKQKLHGVGGGAAYVCTVEYYGHIKDISKKMKYKTVRIWDALVVVTRSLKKKNK